MRLPRLALLLVLGTALTSSAAAQGVTTIVLEGDVIPGVGTVTRIDRIAVNNNGDTFVEVTTNGPSNANQAILKNGNLFLQEGQALTSPAGGTCGTFDAISGNISGNGAFDLSIGGQTSSTNSGVFWNDQLVLQEGTFSTSTAFTVNTSYVRFDQVRINDNDQILMMARVNDPAIGFNSLDACVVILDTDGQGNLTGETVLWKADDAMGNNSHPATQFSMQPHTYDFNNAGQVIHQVFMATGSGANDVAVYLDQTVLAEEASPSPVAGRNWGTLSAAAVGLNNNGDWVLRGALDGPTTDNELLIRNNAKFVQEGDILAATGGWALDKFSTAPTDISDSGDVAWFCKWDDPNTAVDTGIFINMDLVVQEGVTQVGNNTITNLAVTGDAFRLAPSGAYLIFEATLDNGLEGAFCKSFHDCNDNGVPDLDDITNGTELDCNANGIPDSCEIADGTELDCDGNGLVDSCEIAGDAQLDRNQDGVLDACQYDLTNYCLSSSNTSGNAATISGSGLPSVVLNELILEVQGAGLQKFGLFFYGPGPQSVFAGEGLLCVDAPQRIQPLLVTDSAGAASLPLDLTSVPFAGNLRAGDTRYFQFWFRDPLGGPAGFNFSDGLEVAFCQ